MKIKVCFLETNALKNLIEKKTNTTIINIQNYNFKMKLQINTFNFNEIHF